MPDHVTPPGPEALPLATAIQLQEQAILSDPSTARKTLTQLLGEAREAQDTFSEAYVLCLLGGAAFLQGNYDDTLLFANYALRISQREHLPELEVRCLNALGLASTRQGKLDEGMMYYRLSMNAARDHDDRVGLARALINMASTYSDLEAHDRALEMYREGARLAEECQTLPYKADANRGIIEELRHLNRLDEAASLLPEAIELAEIVDFKSILWKLRHSQALLALDDRRLKDALHCTRMGMRTAQEADDYEGLTVMRILLGECLFNLAEYDQAYIELNKGSRLAVAIGLQRIYSRAQQQLAQLFEIRGDAAQALEHLKIHVKTEELLRDQSRAMRSRAMDGEILVEAQRQAQQLQRAQHQKLTSTQRVLEQTHDELLHLSAHDALTDVNNRTSFWRLAQHHLNERPTQDAPPLALLLVDVNDLRAVNDVYGFTAGDTVLKELAQRLQRLVSPEDIVGRLSGDEFMIMVTRPGTPGAVQELAEQLTCALKQPVSCGDVWIEASVSIGYVIGPDDGPDLTTLHRNAELALNAAKQAPHQPVVRFHSQLVSDEQSRWQLKAELSQALTHRQFLLHYQAQYNLHDQQLTGFESLVRWEHPQLGLISPAQFIPLAEQSGLIIELGTWILREACRQASEWFFPALKLSMAVNISPVQFIQPDFHELVQTVLEEFGLPGSCLTLEITEGMAQRNIESSIATSRQLRALGVQVAMDDFGTGYSSLNVLKHFPLDILKIDRAFMTDLLPEHPDFDRTQRLMGAIIGLAHNLGLQVVAEGVESLSQLRILEGLGCDAAQGYALARPSSAPDVAIRLPSLPLEATPVVTRSP